MIHTQCKVWHFLFISFGLLGINLPGKSQLMKNGRQDLPTPSLNLNNTKKTLLAPIFYSNIELRHQINAYVDEQASSRSQEPSVQFRSQLGSVLYHGVVDLYLNLSAEKRPKNLAVFQRRPELHANIYILRAKWLKIRQYNIWRLPNSSKARVDTVYESQWEQELDSDGTVYVVGLNPSSKLEFANSYALWESFVSVDVSSRLYSRAQFAPYVDTRNGELRTIEDHVPRLGSVQSLGGSVSPHVMPHFSLGASMFYRSHFLPYYFQTNDLGVQSRYLADRASYYKLRLQFQLNDRLTLINDFMHFHRGFFASKRTGQEKRYKNIFRVSCVL